MKKWKILYNNSLSKTKQIFDFSHKIMVGFNVNIDKIINFTPEILVSFDFTIQKLKKAMPPIIKNKDDLFLSLIHSIRDGKANELLIESADLAKWIEDNFDITSSHIGGQAGIMANFLKEIGAKHVLLSLPIYNSKIKNLLDSDILFVKRFNDDLKLTPIKTLQEDEKGPITHYIFEFKKGTYTFGDTKIHCKRFNRFIASFDSINSSLAIKDVFYNYSQKQIKDYKLAIISGFHLIKLNSNKESFYSILTPVLKLLREWKKENPKLIIHLELAATNNNRLKKAILSEIFPLIDSIGLNEQELISFLEVIDKKLCNKIKKNLSAINLFEGLFSLFSNYDHLRIHLHFFGYYMVLSPPISLLKAERRIDSLIFSSLAAASKILYDTVSKSTLQNVSLNEITKNGVDELNELRSYLFSNFKNIRNPITGYYSCSKFSLVAVPSIIIAAPKYLVGTGDVVSLVSIISELN